MGMDTIKDEMTQEEIIEAKRQQIDRELKELLEVYRLEAIEERKDKIFRIFHPIKWRKKHKNDPPWIKYKNITGFRFKL